MLVTVIILCVVRGEDCFSVAVDVVVIAEEFCEPLVSLFSELQEDDDTQGEEGAERIVAEETDGEEGIQRNVLDKDLI